MKETPNLTFHYISFTEPSGEHTSLGTEAGHRRRPGPLKHRHSFGSGWHCHWPARPISDCRRGDVGCPLCFGRARHRWGGCSYSRPHNCGIHEQGGAVFVGPIPLRQNRPTGRAGHFRYFFIFVNNKK